MNALATLTLFAADDAMAGVMAALTAYFVVVGIISIVMIVGMWKVFEKAGQPGWAAIVPIYNLYVLTVEVAKKEMLWFILFLVLALFCGPLVLIPAFVVNMEVAKKFGKGGGFGIGLTLLGFIFYPILGFGSAQYQSGRKKKSRDEDDENW